MTARQVAAALAVVLSSVALLVTTPARAQRAVGSPRVTLRLDSLQDAALRHDPRDVQRALLGAQSELRQRSLDAERLPSLGVNAQGQYQSTVLKLPFALPGGATLPSPADETNDDDLAARERW
jgi:hypothetical protein